MIDFGTVRPGTTLYVPFATYDSNDPTASVTMTDFVAGDIEIYKNGGTTARASDTGYTLLGTDGIDEYGTGLHGFSIDLASNATAGFYAAGSQYWVVVGPVTVDGGVVRFVAATFRIGIPDAVLNTTISGTPGSQTSFVLASGPAEDDALNGCVVYIHDVASAVQGGWAVISDYTGSSKTVTLTAATTFTIADTDNVAIFSPVNSKWAGTELGTTVWATASRTLTANTNLNDPTAAAVADAVWDEARSGHVSAGSFGQGVASVQGNVTGSTASIATAGITSTSFDTGAITATAIASDAIGAAELATDAVTEIANAVAALTIEGTLTLQNALKLVLASAAGKVSGADGTTITIRDTTDTYNRIVATVDQYGNRSAISYVTT